MGLPAGFSWVLRRLRRKAIAGRRGDDCCKGEERGALWIHLRTLVVVRKGCSPVRVRELRSSTAVRFTRLRRAAPMSAASMASTTMRKSIWIVCTQPLHVVPASRFLSPSPMICSRGGSLYCSLAGQHRPWQWSLHLCDEGGMRRSESSAQPSFAVPMPVVDPRSDKGWHKGAPSGTIAS